METVKEVEKLDWRGKVCLALFVVVVVVAFSGIAYSLGSMLWHSTFQQPEVVLKATSENPSLDFYAAGQGDRTVLVFQKGEETIRVYTKAMLWFYNLEETEPEYLTGKWNGWPDYFYDDYELHLHRSRPR